jgi:hypothetical protein
MNRPCHINPWNGPDDLCDLFTPFGTIDNRARGTRGETKQNQCLLARRTADRVRQLPIHILRARK